MDAFRQLYLSLLLYKLRFCAYWLWVSRVYASACLLCIIELISPLSFWKVVFCFPFTFIFVYCSELVLWNVKGAIIDRSICHYIGERGHEATGGKFWLLIF